MRQTVLERRDVELTFDDPTPIYVDRWVDHTNVVLLISIRDELAKSGMGEAEYLFKITALHHKELGDDLVRVLSSPHVRPDETPYRVVRRQGVPGGCRALGHQRQMDAVDVADDGQVGRQRAKSDLLR